MIATRQVRKPLKVEVPNKPVDDSILVFSIHPRLACFAALEKIRRYRVVDSEAKLADLRNKMKGLEEFAFDTETNTLRVYGDNKDFKIVGISISWGEYNNYYIPMGHVREEDYGRNIEPELVREYLKDIFENDKVRIIGWNLRLV